MAVAATLMYCAPVFVYLASFVLKLERPTAVKWLAIALVMVGVVLLTKLYAIGAGDLSLMGVATGLLAGLSYALFIFGFKYAAPPWQSFRRAFDCLYGAGHRSARARRPLSDTQRGQRATASAVCGAGYFRRGLILLALRDGDQARGPRQWRRWWQWSSP